METNRVALITYTAPDGKRCVASGVFVDSQRVLTADHVALGTAHHIDFPEGQRDVGAIIRSATLDVDLAILMVTEPVRDMTPLEYARVDRSQVSRLSECVAVGFPRWRRDQGARRSAQVNGWMPTAEGLEPTADSGLRAGLLTLVGDRIPGAPDIPNGVLIDARPNPWGGMSGAGVVVDGALVGVVRSYNLASGGQSLTVTPITAIDQLPSELRHMFWEALGVADPERLPVLPKHESEHLRNVRDYLTAARIIARQHPYALALPGAPELPTVYLHQKINPQSVQVQRDTPAAEPVESPQSHKGEIHITEQEYRRRLARAADESAEQIAEALQRFDIQQVLEQHRGVVLLGGPGTGKSSLLRQLIYEFPDITSDTNNIPFVPVLVPARALEAALALPKAIARAVMAELGSLLGNTDLAEAFASQPIHGIPWLVLLDGIDEILDREARWRVLVTISRWWGDPQYRFLVTSRSLPPGEFQPLEDIHAAFFEIEQFNEDELPSFARRWFEGIGASDASQLVDDFMAQLFQRRLVQLARNPLMATIMCVILANDPERTLPHSRADLYEQFITLLMDKAIRQLHELERLQEYLSPYGRVPQNAIAEVLARSRGIMGALARRQLTSPMTESLIDYAESLTAVTRPENVPAHVWREVLAEMLRQSGIMLESDDNFIFVHHTVMEYLAACELASQKPGPIRKWRLRVAAGRGDSLALFTASVMNRNGVNLVGRTPKILALRRLVHARLVASLIHEGLQLPPGTVNLVRDRLANFAAQRRNCIPDILRGSVWDYEDDCVLAAKSLIFLDKDNGLVTLARAAVDPTVGGFNIYGYNEFLDLDRERALSILSGLASSSEFEAFYRVGVIKFVLGESRDLGIKAAEGLSLDRSAADVLRAEMAFELLKLDRDRGTRVLAALIADPLMQSYRIECEELLTRVDQRRCAAAMAELITNSEAQLSDRAATVERLIEIDEGMARSALENVVMDSQISGLARSAAAVTLIKKSPSDGMRMLRALSGDERAPEFHRVFCLEWAWRISHEKSCLSELVTLAADCRLPGRWRLFAAGQLSEIDRDLALQALAKIREDRTAGYSWRHQAWLITIALRFRPPEVNRS